MAAKLNLAGQRFGLAENHEAERVRRGRIRPARSLWLREVGGASRPVLEV